ncbi:glycosyltransferase family 2 protein [Telluribacter humicola]|uniref:glycosyltransferase family 2 protein n=1 Tax=Telluribacter humicola TaxID=1720261 RepID=UPI001A95CE37|nr:glycosyltransferase family 2 protein [Telluribacter humicola]
MSLPVSIITVAYNSSSTIKETINSVLSQQVDSLEYIVIDGGSTDGSIDILKHFNDKISRWISEPDNGIYDAMNKGLRLATGEVIGFLNSDDLYANKNVLIKVMNIFDTNPEVDIVYGDLIYVESESTTSKVRYWKCQNYYNDFFEDGYVPPHPSFFARSHVFKKAGTFDLNFKLAADYELIFRMLKLYNFKSIYLPEVLVHMRLGGATNKSFRNILTGNTEIVQIWLKHKQPIPLKFWVRRYLLKLNQYFT